MMLRETPSKLTFVTSMFGAVIGAVVGVAVFMTSGPLAGDLSFLFDSWVGVMTAFVASVVGGALAGSLLASVEASASHLFVRLCVRRHLPLSDFGLELGFVCAAINVGVTTLIARAYSGGWYPALVPGLIVATSTALTALFFVWVHQGDWPEPAVRVSKPVY